MTRMTHPLLLPTGEVGPALINAAVVPTPRHNKVVSIGLQHKGESKASQWRVKGESSSEHWPAAQSMRKTEHRRQIDFFFLPDTISIPADSTMGHFHYVSRSGHQRHWEWRFDLLRALNSPLWPRRRRDGSDPPPTDRARQAQCCRRPSRGRAQGSGKQSPHFAGASPRRSDEAAARQW